jgi:hypothetical protein
MMVRVRVRVRAILRLTVEVARTQYTIISATYEGWPWGGRRYRVRV